MRTQSAVEGRSAPGVACEDPGGITARLLLRSFRVQLAVAGGAFVLAAFVAAVYFSRYGTEAQLAVGACLFLALAGLGAWRLVFAPLAERLNAANGELAVRAAHLEERLRAIETDGRLQHALDIAEDESAVLRISEQALEALQAGSSSQLLLAEDPEGDITRTITIGDMPDAARCNIRRAGDCPAVRRGQGMVYEDSMSLSACPGLGGRIETTCAAACTPVMVAGRGTGMLRALGQTGDPDLFRLLQLLTTHANRVGTRLTVIRSMVASEMKAATDPLTGLSNRRVLEARLGQLFERRAAFALVMADIDHFKKINDTHGHEVGDRALKAFAGILRQSIRSEDLACRIGGEEFVLLLPEFNVTHAAQVMQRIRGELPRGIQRAGLPAFTVSAGVVDHRLAGSGDDLLRLADQLLYRAKSEGRDRVILPDDIGEVAVAS
ncbi:GGDEF domain-containing protein [Thermomonas sp.]|uniref:GGDEF domain-containing protein n=1 Tax=Thermomonas sp. TaxID=1971895 RepID=UPI00261AA89C|nr:GGDEF domain-containing protein [Thermomonas sp.]MCO5055939.1 GGDEF domain-containing protein [Thermomonas sp.]